MLGYAILHYTTLDYTTLHYTTLHHTIVCWCRLMHQASDILDRWQDKPYPPQDPADYKYNILPVS